MVGKIARSSSFNTFSSICYCFAAVGIHSYSSYIAVKQHKNAESKAWPGGGGGTPREAAVLLGATIVSLLMLPFFCVTCFMKIGNFANDGVKLGRDHALDSTVETPPQEKDKHEGLRNIWKHFCPLSQTLHLVAAFLLLIPETLLTAVEVKFGYKPTDASWWSSLDFLYSPDRALLSDLRSSVNASFYANATYVFLPTPRVPTEGWGDSITVSVAFVNFCIALACFVIRYSSVFWYTNKALTAVFSLQLLAMAVNSVFSFSSFSILYCVCYNKRMYPNVSLSVNCAVDLFLYFTGSIILLLSSMAVFEYGCHYFHEKFMIVERHHHTDSYVKQTVIVNSGFRGYIPHICAIASLIVFALSKGPLLYDLVSLMRLTDDQLLLSGIVCEVCYMVLWTVLWFGLTIKQQWQFRILDYIPLRQPLYAMPGENMIKYSHAGNTDQSDGGSKVKRFSGRDFHEGYIDSGQPGTASSSDEQYFSDICTEESDMPGYVGEIVLDLDGNSMSSSNPGHRRWRNRRNGGQRVTFEESVCNKAVAEDHHTPTNSLIRQSNILGSRPEVSNHFNVTAHIHGSTPSSTNSSNESAHDVVFLRKKSNSLDNKEYRNSIRNKCGEFYSSVNNLSTDIDEQEAILIPTEHSTTLMSSFRDKVRESSIAASTFKERERHMMAANFDYTDPLPPPIVEDLTNCEGEKRQDTATLNGNSSNLSCRVQSYGVNNGSMNSIGREGYIYDNSIDSKSAREMQGKIDNFHACSASAEFRYKFDDNINDDYKNESSARLSPQKFHKLNAFLKTNEERHNNAKNCAAEPLDVVLSSGHECLKPEEIGTNSGERLNVDADCYQKTRKSSS